VTTTRDRTADLTLPHTSLRTLTLGARAAFRNRPCTLDERRWVQSILQPAEFELWVRQPDYDQMHELHSAQNFARRAVGTPLEGDNIWLAAALLHDVGKSAANLTPRERIIAAPLGKLVKLPMARRWASRAGGSLRRLGLFLTHGEVGARMIREAGGRELVAAWCELHQGDWLPDGCGIPKQVARMLIESEY
jgi:hypothetical protein